LRDLLKRMLDKDPDKRFESTSDLARELEYYIYKDGYGPTIVTLATYMKKTLPGLFERNVIPDNEKTFFDQSGDAFEHTAPLNLEKTMKLPRD